MKPIHISDYISLDSFKPLSYHLRLGLPSGPFLSGFPYKTLVFLFPPRVPRPPPQPPQLPSSAAKNFGQSNFVI